MTRIFKYNGKQSTIVLAERKIPPSDAPAVMEKKEFVTRISCSVNSLGYSTGKDIFICLFN